MFELRDALVPTVSAAIGAGLAVLFYDANPLFAGLAGAFAGAVTGAFFGHRAQPIETSADPRESRIRELEAALDAERTAIAEFKREMEERETANQRFIGDLDMSRTVMEEQASHSVELAEELAEQKMELERSKQRSDYLANHDLLTGLPNRRAFLEGLRRRVDSATANGNSVALLFVDLDKFKEVNDTLGHDAGDDLLKKVSSLLDAAMRDDDLAARLGGEEFAVIIDLPSETAAKSSYNIAERLRLSLQIPTPSPKGEIAVGATIGVALYPQDAADAAELLHAADQVMYAGKRLGRNRVVTTEGFSREELRAAHH